MKILIFLCVLLLYTLCKCDYFIFNYHQFDTDESCTIATWTYHRRTCTSVTYSVQGFYLDDVKSEHLGHPRIELNSSSPAIKFPTRLFAEETMYFRVLGRDSSDEVCAKSDFLNFTTILENGFRTTCLPSQGPPPCLTIPSDNLNRIPFIIWPRSTMHSDDYCFCQANTEEAFSACAIFCGSIYHLSLNGATICLQNDTIMMLRRNDDFVLKIFITYTVDPCRTSQCIITSFISSLWIRSHSDMEEVVTHSTGPPGPNEHLIYHFQNITVISNESLHVNVTHNLSNIGPYQLVWRHNTFALRNTRANFDGRRLTIEAVEPSDAGHYSVLLFDASSCEHAQFKVFVEFLTITSSAMGGTIYSCVATGYPDVQLLMWQSGTRDVIPQSLYNTSSEEDEFSTTLVSTLNFGTCRHLRGYVCYFGNGIFARSLNVHCLPGAPSEPRTSVLYSNNSFSICFEAYSNPRYIVVYDVNITINTTTTYFLNESQCINLTFEEFADPGILCLPFEVSVTARNQFGESAKTEIITRDDSFCRNLLRRKFSFIQIRLQGVLNCTKWTNIRLDDKVMVFTGELANYTRSLCECGFTSSHIYQPSFRCFESSPDYTTFRTYLITFSDTWTSDQLVAVVENWVGSGRSISLLGDVLQIDSQCQVVIPSLNVPECSLTKASTFPTYVIVGSSVSSCAVVILIALILVVCGLTVKRHKRKISIAQKTKQNSLQDSPPYEEIAGLETASVPVYEEIPSQNDAVGKTNYTPCEAYEVTKKASVVDTHDYEDILTKDDKAVFLYTKCAAYGNSKSLVDK